MAEGAQGPALEAAGFLSPPKVNATLHARIADFQDAIVGFSKKPVGRPRRTSGYRPPAYQAHLRELKDLREKLRRYLAQHPDERPACTSLITAIANEVRDHGLQEVASSNGVAYPPDLKDLAVNRPGGSSHETGNALDLAVRSLNGTLVTQTATLTGVARTSMPRDPVHFQLAGSLSRKTLRFRDVFPGGGSALANPLTAPGRVEILVRDPLGRRIGFDPATASEINQIPGAFYSGVAGDIVEIEIPNAEPGPYTLTGVGSQAGAYSITISESTDDGSEVSSDIVSGVAAIGVPIAPEVKDVTLVDADVTAPTVTPPTPVTVAASGNLGARVADVPALAAFMVGGTATDDTDPAPLHLEATIAGTIVTPETILPLGTTEVRFAFDDASRNVGYAVSYVTVVADVVPPGISLRINGSAFRPGDTMTVTIRLAPGLTSLPVDAYVVVNLPDGSFALDHSSGNCVWAGSVRHAFDAAWSA